MNVCLGFSLGSEDKIKGVVDDLRYFEGGHWGKNLCSNLPLGNEGLFKWFAGE
jgi:hypothetical protein